ncbi:trypsin-like peptidase domain-containing protein [Deferribacterales bacterium Es71-Z0220]|uniref:S1C family serine protease n=1 Tax=Deferrivibrio essentukiensis TaxID=2880922 RepID=UPI001F615C55|nr:trypsin-like peptidase domain-containing protein [Deferrivibrio essentukiensis]MCB4204517.1 trypsin-like peptidase domain-containing protein [Deferrivibrio essentukiensis]
MLDNLIKSLIILLIAASFAFSSHRETEVVKAVKLIKNSVINIRTEKIVQRDFNPFFDDPFFGEFFGFKKTYKTESLGSGFFIDTVGTAVTNYHVIKSASKIYAVAGDEVQYEAELIGGDEDLDIAIIKVKNIKNVTPVTLGTSSDIMLGETVIAMGNPYGLESSVSTGVVSNTNRILNINNSFSTFIQIDAPINPGNSGGPLVNLDGEVIGINSAIYKEAQGIGFSIPIDILKRVTEEITKYGKIRPTYTGMIIEETKDGLSVEKVDKGSSAEKIGLKKGDIIYKLNNIPVATKSALKYIFKSYPPGNSFEIIAKRGDKFLKGKIKTDTMPENYGLKLLNDFFGIKFKQSGDYVKVTDSSIPAYLKKGDILLAINNIEIKKISDINEIIINNIFDKNIFTIYRNDRIFKFELFF